MVNKHDKLIRTFREKLGITSSASVKTKKHIPQRHETKSKTQMAVNITPKAHHVRSTNKIKPEEMHYGTVNQP